MSHPVVVMYLEALQSVALQVAGARVVSDVFTDAARNLAVSFRFYNRERLHQAMGYRTPAAVYARSHNFSHVAGATESPCGEK